MRRYLTTINMNKIFQIAIVLLLCGIFCMLIIINHSIPKIRLFTKAELRKINEIEDDDIRQSRLDSATVFSINGDVDATIYNTVDVKVENTVDVNVED